MVMKLESYGPHGTPHCKLQKGFANDRIPLDESLLPPKCPSIGSLPFEASIGDPEVFTQVALDDTCDSSPTSSRTLVNDRKTSQHGAMYSSPPINAIPPAVLACGPAASRPIELRPLPRRVDEGLSTVSGVCVAASRTQFLF